MADNFPARGSGAMLATAFAVVSGFATFGIWHAQLAPIQSFYLATYAKTELLPDFSLFHKGRPKQYLVLTANGHDVTVRNSPESLDGAGSRYTLTDQASFDGWLKKVIFDGESFAKFATTPLIIWGLFALLGMIWGVLLSRSQKKKAHDGKKLRGPDLITRWQFNRRVKGDGFPIKLENKCNFLERLGGEPSKYLRIERRYENNHLLTMSDPGGGKTSLFLQILDEVARRGNEAAIIYDPHMQFLPRYFNAERGDVVLNPLDVRCPPWSPSAELDLSDSALAEAHAMAQATSLFVGTPGEKNWFFTYCCQLIWKYVVVNFQPAAHEMAHLLEHCDPLIDEAVRGTEAETMMAKNAANQRAGLTAHLSQIAYSLRQLPEETQDRKPFVLKDWCESRKGWIFVTNTQNTRDSLRPIQSLWLDTLIMDLLSQGARPDLPPVLMALDEMQTLQRLPQLMPLVTEGRKSLRVLMGFQGRSQLKGLYGETAEAIFSAAYTRFFMRTTEDEASKWVSNEIGDVEIERINESRPAHARAKGSHSYSTQKVIEKLLLPSEFHGLPDREGYLKYGNNVVKIKLPIMETIVNAPGLIPRKSAPVVKKPLPTLELAIEEKEPVEEELEPYVAPPFLFVANNSTVHNARAWGAAPAARPRTPQPARKSIIPNPKPAVETVGGAD